jgi:hypothetical protein
MDYVNNLCECVCETRYGCEVVVVDRDGHWLWINYKGQRGVLACNVLYICNEIERMIADPKMNINIWTKRIVYCSYHIGFDSDTILNINR